MLFHNIIENLYSSMSQCKQSHINSILINPSIKQKVKVVGILDL